MPLDITLDDIEIVDWSVNLERQRVDITYKLKAGTEDWATHRASFWVTLPEPPSEGRDFQLPLAYAQTLLDLTNDAKTALKTYWGI